MDIGLDPYFFLAKALITAVNAKLNISFTVCTLERDINFYCRDI